MAASARKFAGLHRLRAKPTRSHNGGGGGRSDWNSAPTALVRELFISRFSAEYHPSHCPSLPKVYHRQPIQWRPVYMSPPVPK